MYFFTIFVKNKTMITKEYIKELKSNRNGDFQRLIKEQKDIGNIIFILENLGQLQDDFDGRWLLDLINHKNSQVRYWAVKNIGKLNNVDYITYLKDIADGDPDTNVRREAVSSIGRMRRPELKDIFIKKLNDNDPKVVCQAIRGLLVFKGDNSVDEKLKPLINHENEMIRTVIYKEYFSEIKNNNSIPHTETYDFLKNVVVNAETISTMKLIPEEAVHLTFTSPPYYNARDYSIYPSYKAYLEFLTETFKEVHRITKEGRFFILNTSPIIIPRVSRQHSSIRYPIPFDIHHDLVNMGWEFIDDIIWIKPEVSVKDRNGGFKQHRKPLAYKPNNVTEYLMVYRKKTSKLIDWNIRQYDYKTVEESKVRGDYETRNTWFIDPCFDKVHSAVFPIELCNRVVKFYSFKNDLIFDPFGGSGTLGKAAFNLGRYFFMTEQDQKYFERIKSNFSDGNVFNKIVPKFLSFKEFSDTIKL